MSWLGCLPLQKWICAACVLRLWCSECCTCASCTYVQNMCKLLPYLIYAQHVCYLCTRHVLLTHMHATGMLCITTVLRTCRLHTCKLLVFLICATCIHAYVTGSANQICRVKKKIENLKNTSNYL